MPQPTPPNAPLPHPGATSPATPQRLGRWQFGLGGLFQSMFLLCILAGIYGGMIRSVARHDTFATAIFLGMALTVPIGLTIVWSSYRQFRRWWRERNGHG